MAGVAGRNLPVRPRELEPGERLAPRGVRLVEQRAAVEVEQVEEDVGDRVLRRGPPHRPVTRQVHPGLQALEARAPVGAEGHDLAVEDRLVRPEGPAQVAQLGVARGEVVAVARLEAQAPALGVADRPHAVPLDLDRPASLLRARRKFARARQHRLDLVGQRHVVRILRRVHPVDHPVLAAGAEQDVADRAPAPRGR
jgi:hypothetical protein